MQHYWSVILLLLLFFSCRQATTTYNEARNSEVYFCNIYKSSQSDLKKSDSQNIYLTENPAQDEIIIYSFYRPVFVKRISIIQLENSDFARIDSVDVYTNHKKAGCFEPNEILINDTVSFLIFRLSQISDFHLTDAYSDKKKYQIAFDFLNKIAAIENILFYKNDTTIIDIVAERKYFSRRNERNFSWVNKKIVDFTGFEKSVTLKSNGQIIGFVKGKKDTIFFGYYSQKNKKAELNKYIFDENFYAKQHIDTKFDIKDNLLIIRQLQSFRYDFADSFLVDIKTLDTTIVEDIRYATENNFTHKQIYNCPACLMRYGAAKDFVAAEKEFMSLGYRIKVFDCYRPHSAQYKLWEVVPNINYVANPDKGSIHNRGAAVDMTLVDSLGNQLDMGTPFDYFGYKAYSINEDLPDTVLKNRQLMWSVMHKHGFKVIKTEWWHLSHYSCLRYSISDIPLPCE